MRVLALTEPPGKNTKHQAVRKQMQNTQKVPVSPISSPLLSVFLDLYIVSDAADEAPSGMGDHTADAASSPPGGLPRVLVVIVMREPPFFLLVSLSH